MPPIHGLIAATFTPMHDNGTLQLALVPELVELLIARGLDGLYVCGSTGEGPLLTSDEREAVAEAFVRAAAGRIPVVVQVGHASQVEAQRLAAHAQAIGADAISATPSTYFKPSGIDAVIDGIVAVATAAPALPFFYYHIPPITGVAVDATDLLPRAAARAENVAGIKFSSPAIHEFTTLDLARFRVLFGVDEMLLAGLASGAHGAVGSTHNLIPGQSRAIMTALAAGDLIAARAEQRRATAIIRRLVRNHAVPMLKAAMAFTGIDVGPTRAPLARVSRSEIDTLRHDLQTAGWWDAFCAPH